MSAGRRTTRLLILVGAALVALAATSCVAVKPWQRELLAKKCMLFDEDPDEIALEEHLLAFREGAAGGFGGGGGGCGCN